MKAFIQSLLGDNSGGISAIRGLAVMWLVTLCAVWAFVALRTLTLPDIPGGVQWITAVIIGGKVVQRFGEKLEGTP
jgi:uncharacterized membrane-anchored protein